MMKLFVFAHLFLISRHAGAFTASPDVPTFMSSQRAPWTIRSPFTGHLLPDVSLSRTRRLYATLANDIDQHLPRNETSSSSSSLPKRRSFADDYSFNEALNRLAEQAGSVREPVIRRAAACEDLWNDFLSSPDEDWQPDTISFNTVLKAWTRAGSVLAEQHSASSTPQHLLDPDIQIFSARDCARHAMTLLEEQEKKHEGMDEEELAEAVSRPDLRSYNSVMGAWAKSRTSEALAHVKALWKRMLKCKIQPDRISYSALMEAYAYSDREDALEEVEKIWNSMITHADERMKPNSQVLVVLLHALSRISSKTALNDKESRKLLADKAISFVRQQEERYEESHNPYEQPDAMVYTAAIDLMGKVAAPEYAQHAQEMWQKIKSTRCDPGKPLKHLQPTIYTYTSLITAWSRVTDRDPQAVERVAEVLNDLFEDDAVELNSRPFTAAMRGYARSCYPLAEEPNKAVAVLKLVQRVREDAKGNRFLRLNRMFYNAAIDCCAKVFTSHELQTSLTKNGSTIEIEASALKIAFALYKTMSVDKITPDSDTYAKLLLCTSNLLPRGAERTQVAESVFLKAKNAGSVDKNVLFALQNAVECEYWQRFIVAENLLNERGRIDWNKIPHAWSKNAR